MSVFRFRAMHWEAVLAICRGRSRFTSSAISAEEDSRTCSVINEQHCEDHLKQVNLVQNCQ